ncbi:MAG: tRNA 2-thiouridine(34) synthase MnmA [Bacteroidales bacterium]|nr:tRNA 2-thiouridine(34) synthase MnmA [Bacteroidales bacterium]
MAMSGGIDSTVSAMLLQEQGCELVGVTFRTFDSIKEHCLAKEKGCCSVESIMEAKHMAEKLGFEHHIVDFREVFKEKVISNFIQEYLHGRTPNPCVLCNSHIKWGVLMQQADALGCEKIATGHYACIRKRNGRTYLATAADTHKDQTYFPWMLTEENLQRTLFPLGGHTKEQVRQMAAERGFETLSHKRESQEICFIPDNDYRHFLEKEVPDFHTICPEGNYIGADGKVLGRHKGFACYTIGQRKGLGIALGRPRYVTMVDALRNEVTLGDYEDLYTTGLLADACRIREPEWLQNEAEVEARIRYKSPAQSATLQLEGEKAQVHFARPVWGVTPGQSVVFYKDGLVAGGGIISSVPRFP